MALSSTFSGLRPRESAKPQNNCQCAITLCFHTRFLLLTAVQRPKGVNMTKTSKGDRQMFEVGSGTTSCHNVSKILFSAHLAKLVDNALQALREVDVRLGNRAHHSRHQPHRPPPRVGLRLAPGLQPSRRRPVILAQPRIRVPHSLP